jgi:hypothetical protein
MNALDVITRAVKKEHAEEALLDDITTWLDAADACPGQFKTRLKHTAERACQFARDVANAPENERYCRQAASGLYHAQTAALMAAEGAVLGASGGDARRLLLARLVLDRRLNSQDALSMPNGGNFENDAADLLLNDKPVDLDHAVTLVTA